MYPHVRTTVWGYMEGLVAASYWSLLQPTHHHHTNDQKSQSLGDNCIQLDTLFKAVYFYVVKLSGFSLKECF